MKPLRQKFVYNSENNLGWKWLSLIAFTVLIIQLWRREGARYEFKVSVFVKKTWHVLLQWLSLTQIL